MRPRTPVLLCLCALLACCALACATPAQAPAIRISKLSGQPFLSVVVVEQNRPIEKHAKALGLGDVKVQWVSFGGGGTATDWLLVGDVDFVTSGFSSALLLWSRTGGQVKALAATRAVPHGWSRNKLASSTANPRPTAHARPGNLQTSGADYNTGCSVRFLAACAR
jgi:ABC-type nitrate/sulfonate/bicarbonate transport system substrate-binding protein